MSLPAVPVMSWGGGEERRGVVLNIWGDLCLPGCNGGRGYSDVNTDKRLHPAGRGLSLEELV